MPPVRPGFYNTFPWRFIFTDLSGATKTWAQGLQRDRALTFTLGQSATIEMALRPDDFRVNGLMPPDAQGVQYPRVSQSNTLIYGFRREGFIPWVCRAAGILMSPEDQADEDVPLSHVTAYDARKLLEGRPAVDASGALPDSQGFRLTFLTDGVSTYAYGTVIALTFLKNTISSDGTVRIDAGDGSRSGEGPQYQDWGGTAFYGGTLEVTAPLDLNIQQGQMVSDVWNAVEASGNCDIILRPIYDPINRPGYTHEVSIYARAGADKYDVVMAWDMLNRSVAKIDRMHDATPGNFIDKVQYYAGQGGAPVPFLGPLVNNDALTAFGAYWSSQFFPALQTSVTDSAAVLAMANQALVLAKQGKRTVTIDTVTERAKVPLRDYEIGDRVNVHATKRLRVTSDGLQRVEAIPISITDDGLEQVLGLLTSADYREPTPVPGEAGNRGNLAATLTAVETGRLIQSRQTNSIRTGP